MSHDDVERQRKARKITGGPVIRPPSVSQLLDKLAESPPRARPTAGQLQLFNPRTLEVIGYKPRVRTVQLRQGVGL